MCLAISLTQWLLPLVFLFFYFKNTTPGVKYGIQCISPVTHQQLCPGGIHECITGPGG